MGQQATPSDGTEASVGSRYAMALPLSQTDWMFPSPHHHHLFKYVQRSLGPCFGNGGRRRRGRLIASASGTVNDPGLVTTTSDAVLRT